MEHFCDESSCVSVQDQCVTDALVHSCAACVAWQARSMHQRNMSAHKGQNKQPAAEQWSEGSVKTCSGCWTCFLVLPHCITWNLQWHHLSYAFIRNPFSPRLLLQQRIAQASAERSRQDSTGKSNLRGFTGAYIGAQKNILVSDFHSIFCWQWIHFRPSHPAVRVLSWQAQRLALWDPSAKGGYQSNDSARASSLHFCMISVTYPCLGSQAATMSSFARWSSCPNSQSRNRSFFCSEVGVANSHHNTKPCCTLSQESLQPSHITAAAYCTSCCQERYQQLPFAAHSSLASSERWKSMTGGSICCSHLAASRHPFHLARHKESTWTSGTDVIRWCTSWARRPVLLLDSRGSGQSSKLSKKSGSLG